MRRVRRPTLVRLGASPPRTARPTKALRCLASELIADALSEVEACEQATAQRRPARPARASVMARELRSLVGGDEATIDRLRGELVPPEESARRDHQPSSSFWNSTAAMLAELAPLPQKEGGHQQSRGTNVLGAQREPHGHKRFFVSAAALLVPMRLLEGLKSRRRGGLSKRASESQMAAAPAPC